MRRVTVVFLLLAVGYPLFAWVMSAEFGAGGALALAGVATAATLLLGVPAFILFHRRGWLRWWQFAVGGGAIGLACTLPFAVGGATIVGALAPAFLALGAVHGLVFWALAIWRNRALLRPPGAAAAGPPTIV